MSGNLVEQGEGYRRGGDLEAGKVGQRRKGEVSHDWRCCVKCQCLLTGPCQLLAALIHLAFRHDGVRIKTLSSMLGHVL